MQLLCEVMKVSRSGYYRYLNGKRVSEHHTRENKLLCEVKALAKASQNSYGSRQMAKNLQAQGYKMGRYAARNLMRKAAVYCKQRRRYRVTTASRHRLPVAGNKLNRQFKPAKPNRAWVTDITYVSTLEGWLYVAAVMDLGSRRIIGWSINKHMRETLVQEALQMALQRRQPPPGLLHHSDQGKQYVGLQYQAMLKAAGIEVSMSRKGNC